MKVQNSWCEMEKCELYTCLRKSMRMCRWFGFCPLEGLDSNFISGVRFNVKSYYSYYLLFTIIGHVIMTYATFVRFISARLSMIMLVNFSFYLTSLASTLLMIRFCYILPKLLKEISKIEGRIMGFKLTKETFSNIDFWSNLIFIVAFVVHAFYIIYLWKFITYCLQIFDFEFPAVKRFFTLKMAFISEDSPLKFWGGVLLEITNIQTIFMWNYVDVLVIAMGIYLSSYFKELNKKIQAEGKNMETNWGRLRAQYSNLVILVKKVDSELSPFVIISFSSNLLFTCMQLFKFLKVTDYDFGNCNTQGALEAENSWEHNVFYSVSFALLIMRTAVVCLMTANVNSYSREPLAILGEIDNSKYDFEIQRFTRQVIYTQIGVSGVFFTVTRKLILKVLGTLITYELMLVQFNYRTADTHTNGTNHPAVNEKKMYYSF